ncbi:MAG: hypothetical protein ACI3ZQ_02960 [Candidatus Cryptobacteroides sp.]
MRELLLTVVVFLCSGYSFIYAGNPDSVDRKSGLTVKVTEAGSGVPLQMVSVYLVPANDTIVSVFSFTDKKGLASLKDFPSGRYVVNVQMLGFKPFAEELLFEPRIVRHVSVALEENPELLEGAGITEMGDLVSVKGDTLVYNATSFHTADNSSLGDLLKKMPGMEVSNGRVKVNGEPVKRITVEGRTFFFDDQSKALENLPAVIVNQIRVIDRENGGRLGLSGKEMDIRLKDEYREAWFGKAAVEGGITIGSGTIEKSGSDIGGLYNAKLYAQFYGENDSFNILGGGNNVNMNQLAGTSPGLSDVASAGINYNTSRLSGYSTSASAVYDFRNDSNSSVSRRTSFLSSGDRFDVSRSRKNSSISHSAKANFSIGVPMFESSVTEGFVVNARFRYKHAGTASESLSSTNNSSGETLNGSETHETGTADDFSANVNIRAKYFLDKDMKHHLSFGGGANYDGLLGKSRETSVAHLSSETDVSGLLYADRNDAARFDAYADYLAVLSDKWNLHSVLSADFDSSSDNRNADNAGDGSRNDYYSRYAKDSRLNLKQTLYTSYETGKGRDYFDVRFGVSVYENHIGHFSKLYGGIENRNTLWQVNAGPEFRIAYKKRNWNYILYTNGNSVRPSLGSANSTILDVSNPLDVSTGNIYLKTAWHQDISLSVSRGAMRSGSYYLNIRFNGSMDLNEMTMASWYDASAVRYSVPVNAGHPRYNANLNMTYIQPLNRKKSLNLTITPKVLLGAGTIYVAETPLKGMDREEFNYSDFMGWFYGDSEGSDFYSGKSGFIENRTRNLVWSLNADLKYELRTVSIRGGAAVNNTYTRYSATPAAKVNNWKYTAYAEVLWQDKNGWELESRFEFDGYSGFSHGYNRPDYLLNFRLAKSIKSFTVSLSAYDILGSAKSFTHTSSAEYVEDTYSNRIGRCILIGLSYNFGKWNLKERMKMSSLEKSNSL